MGRWLDKRLRENEAIFPQLRGLRANVEAATAAVEAATSEAETRLANDHLDEAMRLLCSSIPQ